VSAVVEFAREIVSAAGLRRSSPLHDRGVSAPAPRPAYSVLRSGRSEAPVLRTGARASVNTWKRGTHTGAGPMKLLVTGGAASSAPISFATWPVSDQIGTRVYDC